jgi:putative transposase
LFLGAALRYSPSRIIQIIKSITAREMFNMFPEIKKELWGGEFWSDCGYVATISDQPTERVIREYIENQGSKEEK